MRTAQVVADLGSLQLGNVVRWMGSGSGEEAGDALRDPSAVLVDTMTITMRGLGAKVDAEGHSGDNIVREYDEGTQVTRAPRQQQKGGATLCAPAHCASVHRSGLRPGRPVRLHISVRSKLSVLTCAHVCLSTCPERLAEACLRLVVLCCEAAWQDGLYRAAQFFQSVFHSSSEYMRGAGGAEASAARRHGAAARCGGGHRTPGHQGITVRLRVSAHHVSGWSQPGRGNTFSWSPCTSFPGVA